MNAEAKDVVQTIFGDCSAEDFVANHWNQVAKFSPRSLESLPEIVRLSVSEFFRIAMRPPNQFEEMEVVSQFSKEILASASKDDSHGGMTARHGFGAVNFGLELFRKGCSFELMRMQRQVPRFQRLCNELRRDLGISGDISVDAMLSPPDEGATEHFDMTSTISIQLLGTKRWQVSNRRALVNPTMSHFYDEKQEGQLVGLGTRFELEGWERKWDRSSRAKQNIDEFEMTPGDVMFIPAGTWHETTAGENGSFALLIQLAPQTPDSILLSLLTPHLRHIPHWRAIPALGNKIDDQSEMISTMLTELRDAIDGVLKEPSRMRHAVVRDVVKRTQPLDHPPEVMRRTARELMRMRGWEEAPGGLEQRTPLRFADSAPALVCTGDSGVVMFQSDHEVEFQKNEEELARWFARHTDAAFEAGAALQVAPDGSWEYLRSVLVGLIDGGVLERSDGIGAP